MVDGLGTSWAETVKVITPWAKGSLSVDALSDLAAAPAAPAAPAAASSARPAATTASAARDDEVLFLAIDTLVDVASLSARQGKLKQAAGTLRRAYGMASERVEAGLLVGRVARAAVAVQYCALLSRWGQHMQALKEALAAAKEAEEVWGLLLAADEARQQAVARKEVLRPDTNYGVLLKDPPKWLQKAAKVLVESKHCVALELEYGIATGITGIGGEELPERLDSTALHAVWELIPALHREAAALASQLLPPGDALLALSAKTEAQALERYLEGTAAKTTAGRKTGHAAAGMSATRSTAVAAKAEAAVAENQQVASTAAWSKEPFPASQDAGNALLRQQLLEVRQEMLEDQCLDPPGRLLPPSPLRVASAPLQRPKSAARAGPRPMSAAAAGPRPASSAGRRPGRRTTRRSHGRLWRGRC